MALIGVLRSSGATILLDVVLAGPAKPSTGGSVDAINHSVAEALGSG